MNVPPAHNIPNRGQIRDWWSQQAATTTAEPGVLPLAGSTALSQLYRQQAEWIVFRSMIRLEKYMLVLELGCGAGRWAFRIAPHVRHVTAIDLSPEMIRIAKERQCAKNIKNVDYEVAAAEDFLSYTKFDVIYLSSVDQYLEDDDFSKMVAHVRSMLVPGGVLIDRVTIRDGARAYLSLENGYWVIHRTFSELDSHFTDAGLVFCERRPSNNPFIRLPYKLTSRPWFLTFICFLLRIFPRISCSLMEKCTRWLNAWRPIKHIRVSTSHDFLRYDLPSSSEAKTDFPSLNMNS